MIIIFLFQKWELKLIVEIHYHKCLAQKKVPSFRKLAAVIFHENNSLFFVQFCIDRSNSLHFWQ